MKLTEKQLQAIIDTYEKLDLTTKNAERAGCLDANGPLFEAIWTGFENMLAIMDEDSWISWYIYDNEMGKKDLSVTINSKKFKVKTVKTLLRVINS